MIVCKAKPTWRDRKAEADEYMPDAEAIIRRCLSIAGIANMIVSRIAPADEDQKFGADLLFNLRVSVGVRVRKPWPTLDDFTIRTKTRSGRESELSKILRGYPDFLFYAIRNKSGGFLHWKFCRWSIFRDYYLSRAHLRPGIHKPNDDGTAFGIFLFRAMLPGFVIASSDADQ